MNVYPARRARRQSGAQIVFPLVVAAMAIALGSTSCAPRPGPVLLRHSAVERVSADELRVRWPSRFSNGSVEVFAGRSPDEIDRGVAVASGRGGTVQIHSPEHQRLYFEVVADDGSASPVMAERRLPLEGSLNFRDFGGYETVDGRTIRWGRLYRSDDLSTLTVADRDYLESIGIKLVCDFRSDNERTSRPSEKIDARGWNTVNLTVKSGGMDPSELQRKIRTGGLVGLEMERTLQSAYRSYVTDYKEEWAAMFERIADADNLPAVLHCTAGKDRTGFASALVLLALGVPREIVYEDYLLTNTYLENFQRFVVRWTPLYSFFRTNTDDLLPLLEARRLYLETSLATIDALYGSFDGYLENALGVDAKRRAALRANLLS